MTLEPETIVSIKAQGMAGGKGLYRCGCILEKDDKPKFLCQYHQGYDEGADAAKQNCPAQP